MFQGCSFSSLFGRDQILAIGGRTKKLAARTCAAAIVTTNSQRHAGGAPTVSQCCSFSSLFSIAQPVPVSSMVPEPYTRCGNDVESADHIGMSVWWA